MLKKILSIIATIALIATMAVVLVACNADTYESRLEKTGYSVTVSENDSSAVKLAEAGLALMDGYEGGIEWIVTGYKSGTGNVTITKFDKIADAKQYIEDLGGESESVVRQLSYVIAGSKDAVKDAK